jgi:translation initiation factor 2 subunit 1
LLKKEGLPSINELCIATVDKIFELGAYVKLDEYGGLEAYLPWNEVSSKWVKNIREVIKEGQKIVVKVIRVDRRKNQVDVSLKRVAEAERKRKIREWKRTKRAWKILETAAKRLGAAPEEAYSEVWLKLERSYGDAMAGLEEAAAVGAEVLRKVGVPDRWIDALMEEVPKHIRVKRVKIAERLIMTTYEPDGVYRIREILKALAEVPKEGVTVRIYTEGAPMYVVELVGSDYKVLEATLSEMVSKAETLGKKLGVSISFERIKLG